MMKYVCLLITVFYAGVYAQEDSKINWSNLSFDASNFYGTVLKHNPDISHLITGRPSGVILSAQLKSAGTKEWQRLYNYPDYGVSFIYQDLDNEFLGENFGLCTHYNFYFLNRSLFFRIGQGLGYNTNPYDEDDNYRNIAYGSRLSSVTYMLLNYKKENIVGGLGLQAGLGLVHYSNGNFKAPNKSTNTLFFNVGATYQLEESPVVYAKKEKGLVKGSEPFGFGVVFRSGVNQSDLVGSAQFPFYTFGVFVDKRLNKKSAIQLGTEVFFSTALKRYIDYRAVGGFNDGTTGDEDARRVGVFLGHELRLHRTSIIVHLGYYAYYPYEFEGVIYDRLALQYYFTKNIFGSIAVRAHAAKAETGEFSLGYRF